MNNILYSIDYQTPDTSVITAKCQLPLYGRWSELQLTFYCMNNSYLGTSVAVNYSFGDLPASQIRGSKLNAISDGIVRLSRGDGGNRQIIEQKLYSTNFYGVMVRPSYINDTGVEGARIVCQFMFRQIETIVEAARQHIRRQIARSLRDEVLLILEDRFAKHTENAVQALLGDLFWKFLLDKANPDEEFLRVIEYTTTHNRLHLNSILEDDEPFIDFHSPFVSFSISDAKATELLRTVCGSKLGDQFEAKGYITVENHGYKFKIQPRKFILCTDPNGKKAELCIHTASLSCNPIDEVLLAYLYIKNMFTDYMKTAILQRHDRGFVKVP